MEKELYNAILPFYIFCKCFGLVPLTLKTSGFVSNPRDVVFSSTWLILFCVGFALTLVDLTTINYEHNDYISQLGGWFEVYGSLSIVVTGILFNIFYRNRVIQIFEILFQVDQFFQQVNEKIVYQRFYTYFPIIFIIWEYLEVTLTDYFYFMDDESVLYLTINYLPILSNSAVRFMFIQMVVLLNQRLACLNKHLKKIYQEVKGYHITSAKLKLYRQIYPKLFLKNFKFHLNTISYDKEDLVIESLHSAAPIHEQMYSAAEIINSCYSINMLLCFALAFFIIVTQLHHCYITISKENNFPLKEVLSSLNWAGIQILEAVFIVGACSKLKGKANEFVTLLHKIGCRTNSRKIKNSISVLSMQSFHQTIKFSACGFFDLNFSLLYSIVGAVTTYLVFMIQFDNK